MFTLSKPNERVHPPSAEQTWRYFLRAAWVALAVVISACGGSSGGDGGAAPTVSTPSDAALKQPASYVMFTLVDALTGAPIAQDSIVTLSGNGASQAVTASGAAVTQIKTSFGGGAFELKSSATPSVTTPVVIQLGVVSSGYLSSGALLNITEAGPTEREIRLLRASFDATGALMNAPAGVTGRQVTTISKADGSLASNSPDGSFTLTIPSSGGTIAVTTASGDVENAVPPAASISVPSAVKAGRLVTNASGVSTFVPAAAGPITASVVAFSPQSGAALRSFPGGFGVLPSSGGGIAAPSVFQTAGFSAFNFTDSAGNPVDRFSGPVTVTIEAPSATVAPGGSSLSVGSSLPIWSYNASAPEWKSEGTGVVSGKAANGNWIVSFVSSHLSYWSMDWVITSCDTKINILGLNGDRRRINYVVNGEGGAFWAMWRTYGITDDFWRFDMAPSEFPVTIVAYDTNLSTTEEVGRLSNVSLCAGTPINLNVKLSPLPPPRVVNFRTEEACADGSNVRPISTYLFVTELAPPLYPFFNVWTNDAGMATHEFYTSAAIHYAIQDRRADSYRQPPDFTPPAAGESMTVTNRLTMNCEAVSKPTGATGGTGGSGGSGGSSGSGST